MTTTDLSAPWISREIWERKYRLKDFEGRPLDGSFDETVWRVARAAAAAEADGKKGRGKIRERWARTFHDAIADLGFLPGGRILAGAGATREVTLFNCFVMGRIADDLGAIFDGVKEAALTMQQGGGVGMDFSTLRPKGALVASIGADASGPVSFMDVWDAMCRTIMSAGARRGAMMATLRCDHPDIEAFIAAKSDPSRLRNFNLSVLVSDAFITAVRQGRAWELVFEGKVYKRVEARALWEQLMRATYDYAEPGVIFIDRINRHNNLAYCEEIRATNPCGEQPLPPYGACLLGSINLTRFVSRPFTQEARLDTAALESRVEIAVRFLDDVIDISRYPLDEQRREARAKRRIGLGVTGLADALILCSERYGSVSARSLAAKWMSVIEEAAYRTSAALAAEKGAFPLFDKKRFLESPNVRRLAPDVRRAIARHGIRNGCLTSIAPTGTISLLAGNVSSGIEPVFDFTARRRMLEPDGTTREVVLEDFALAEFRRLHGPERPLPASFVRAGKLSPHEHLEMQAVVQRHVDSSISKTINCPRDMPFEAFKSIYLEAYDLGLKGCTTYRPNPVTGAVLEPAAAEPREARIAPPGNEASVAPAGAPEDAAAGAQGPVAIPGAASGRLADGRQGDVVYLAKPLEREAVLAGYTYKLKWPGSDHAIYVTINDIACEGVATSQGAAARRRPFEIFINSRNLEHYAWTVALTRMISAVFRRGGDVSFVAEELKAVFDPQGGRWISGRYVPSLLAAIGEVIEAHMIRIGFMPPRSSAAALSASDVAVERRAARASEDAARPPADAMSRPSGAVSGDGAVASQEVRGARFCPRCSSADYVRQEGCWVCNACGFSRCG